MDVKQAILFPEGNIPRMIKNEALHLLDLERIYSGYWPHAGFNNIIVSGDGITTRLGNPGRNTISDRFDLSDKVTPAIYSLIGTTHSLFMTNQAMIVECGAKARLGTE